MTSANRDNKLIKFSFKFTAMLQDYYAEMLHRMYVIGANFAYRALYAVIKPFLAEKTKQKLIMVGKEFNELQANFDLECLLPEHSGISDFVYDPYQEWNLKRESDQVDDN
eukprot:CAMPEP_0116871370 /NCGR_PEP_ID=MMETSP0463-20121206/1678_1 /TAXON_ID=181622 /ORGANISM="Strombidinopsis sp, Strain SopsisLIS2011" /LENGTH=109 /DNA_ID=CAMNT_0004509639 /DNA_START=429 /DNA_END=755 /DNA_ORIENTATION=+